MSKDDDRAAFEARIAADRYDIVTRLVYADWLEENGHDDEAVEQRRCTSPAWQEAARWMEDRAADCGVNCVNYAKRNPDGSWSEEEYEAITFETMIEAGHNFVNNGDYFVQQGSEDARDMIHGGNLEAFWRHWQTITGIDLTGKKTAYGDVITEQGPFSCSC